MTQTERRIFLIEYLLKEAGQEAQLPQDEGEQKILLRGLMNIREPKPISEEFLKIQDEYLTERKLEKGIVTLEEIVKSHAEFISASQKETPKMTLKQVQGDKGNSTVRHSLTQSVIFTAACRTSTRAKHDIHSPQAILWKGDITRLQVDAIVNAANSGMTGCYGWNHICIDNAIHTFAGVQLRLECDRLMREQGHPEPTGSAKITPAYNLPSKYVVHTVGPIVQGKLNERHELALKSCYKSCLDVAVKNGCKSIAFCCISTGVFMFPKQRAAEIAIETCREFLTENDGAIKIVFNVFGNEDFEIYKELLYGR